MEGREGTAQVGAVIGRADCDIELPDPDVSRRHAIVRGVGQGVAIEDLDSTNGTFVNDKRISEVTGLKGGDKVRFGNTIWRVRGPEASQSTHVAEAPPADETRVASQLSSSVTLPPPQEASIPAAQKATIEDSVPAVQAESDRVDSTPSVIRRALPPDAAAAAAGAPRRFSPAPPRSGRSRSAARRLEAAVASYVVVLVTAVAVAAYLIQR